MNTKKYVVIGSLVLACLLMSACQPALQPQSEVPSVGQGQENPTDVPAEVSSTGGAQTGTATVALTGLLWNDLCEVEPGTAPDPMPAGCIANAMGAAQANGVLDQGESVLAGVTVELGAGACPSTGLASAITDETGQFSISADLPADRVVCVSVDAGSDGNAALLLDGVWTAPTDTQGSLATWTITVPDGQSSFADLNFGWDFYALGSAASFTITELEANCRSGPGTLYQVAVIVRDGEQYPVIGRNSDSSWIVVDLGNGSNCWVSAVVGTIDGNLVDVVVAAAPPPPQITATPQQAGGQPAPTATKLSVVNCRDYHTETECKEHSSCKWYGAPLNMCNQKQ